MEIDYEDAQGGGPSLKYTLGEGSRKDAPGRGLDSTGDYALGRGSSSWHGTLGGGLRKRNNDPGGGLKESNNDPGGGSRKRNNNPGGGLKESNNDPGGGSRKRNNNPGGGLHTWNDTLGGGSRSWKGSLDGRSRIRNDTPGGELTSKNETQGGGLRLKYRAETGAEDGNRSTAGECRARYSRHETIRGGKRKRYRLRQEPCRLQGRRHSESMQSETGNESSTSPSRRSRIKRQVGRVTRTGRITRDSSETRSESPSPKRSRLSKVKATDRDVLMNKFLDILGKVKSSDKPKLAFNANVVPEFDPLSKDQSVLTWITKIEECAEIYGWEEREIIHYSLPKLTGVAKTWYQGLTSMLHTWAEWKKKLIESFPCREDYAELLTEMLAKKAKYGDSLEHYYYAKINLLNRCAITSRRAVDCILYGIEDRAVKVGAQAAQFREPEQVLKYFKTVKIGQSRDNQDFVRKGRLSTSSNNRTDSLKSGNLKSMIRCFNCNEIGHPSFRCGKSLSTVKCHNCNEMGHRSNKCEKPPSKCTVCDRDGHLTANCYRNPARSTTENGKNSSLGNNSKFKQVSEVTNEENTGIDKYVMDIKVNASTIACHVDLGSQCSLIRVSGVTILGLSISHRENLPTLRGIGASIVKPLGVVVTTVEVQGIVETIDLYVVDDYVLIHPVLLGHTFTERPDILIIKTPEEIKFERMPPNKINLVAAYDCDIPCNTMRAIQVSTGAQSLNCIVHVNGTLCGPEGKEYYLLPGQYDIKNGRGAILVYNVSSKPMNITAGTLLTRSLERNHVTVDNMKNSFSVVFDDTVMASSVNCNPKFDTN